MDDTIFPFIVFLIALVVLVAIVLVWQLGGFSNVGKSLNDIGCNLITKPLGGSC